MAIGRQFWRSFFVGAASVAAVVLGFVAAQTFVFASSVDAEVHSPETVRLLAAGDIGVCDSPAVADVGAYVSGAPDATFLALGDIAYPDGSSQSFAECYDPFFGEAKGRTLPVVGNKEYETEGAAGYIDYYGEGAGEPDQLWYSTDIGGWHIVVLNGNCWLVGGCSTDDPQYQWLERDLAATNSRCILAAWHEAYFTSENPDGAASYMEPYYRLLDDAGTDILLSGHSHNYERFAKMDAGGNPNLNGIRSFVVGTGGTPLRTINEPATGSEVYGFEAWGVLELDLTSFGYRWDFATTSGTPLIDSGEDSCTR